MTGDSLTAASDIVTFRVCDMLCGLDIVDVQEIKRIHQITAVHRAPPEVRGVVNMRGRIVTIIDVRQKLGFAAAAVGRRWSSSCPIVRSFWACWWTMWTTSFAPSRARLPLLPTTWRAWSESFSAACSSSTRPWWPFWIAAGSSSAILAPRPDWKRHASTASPGSG